MFVLWKRNVLFSKSPIQVGSTGGTWKLIFAEWAELGEKIIPFYIYVCPKCGKI
jgi:hypothetical protein